MAWGARTARQQSDDPPRDKRPPDTTVNLKILLFNVWQLPGWLTDGAAAQRASRAARLIARSGADVVCLNEAFLRGDAVLSEVKGSHPHRAELAGRASFLTPMGSGIRVASRAPIAATAGRFFQSRAGADRWASKGVLHARLDLAPLFPEVAAATLDLFVTHMQAGASPPEQASRERQAAEAAAFLRERAPAPGGFLLAGDLNMSPCAAVSPHCATEEDARCRSQAFGAMCAQAGIVGGGQEAQDQQQQPEEICRFCVGGGGGGGSNAVRLVRVTNLGRRCPDTGELASDTDALLAEVEIGVRGGGGGGSGKR